MLDQATGKLQLRGAARKLYTEDGNLILDVQDLITWAVEHYKKELNKKENGNLNKICLYVYALFNNKKIK